MRAKRIRVEYDAECRACDGGGDGPEDEACDACWGHGSVRQHREPYVKELAAWLAERPELWAELQEAMRTATGGPLPSSDCVGGGR